jgi:predicted amidohydrolase YtcJ
VAAETTIYTAKKIHTMNPSRPFGTAVAVREGRVLGVGEVEELLGWGEATIDNRFDQHVLLPGFVEGHCHAAEGALWSYVYVGYFDRRDPAGKVWKAVRSIDDLVARLKEADAGSADRNVPLIAWGFDPIYFAGERLTAAHLDRVSETRPVFVLHASMHLATVNSALLKAEGISASTDVEGVQKDANGNPTGELQELHAMSLVKSCLGLIVPHMASEEALRNLAREARNTGVTTFTELGTLPLFDSNMIALLSKLTNDPEFPGRIAPFANPMLGFPNDLLAGAQYVASLRNDGNDKLYYGNVKLVLDGSPQGFTAQIDWPHYFKGRDQGVWNIPPEQLPAMVEAFHSEGSIIHAHCNGTLSAEVFIDAVEHALERHPRWDHRHTLQHSPFTTNAQYRRMKALDMCVNLFINHVYYWGDQHYAIVVGPDRAESMAAAATVHRMGIPFSMHCDASVTPLGGLEIAANAVNRLTASGRVLGEREKIDVYTALEAVTLGAAYTLKLDGFVGSIECGKFADFAVLDADPFDTDSTKLEEIGVWGTVVGGLPFEAEHG